MSTSAAFDLLAPALQQFLWMQQWTQLRPVQEQAILALLEQQQDVVIAASTASGKTEAAFLPLLTQACHMEGRALLLYVSPLKALINDQYGRLSAMCESLDFPVWPWHGDVSASVKQRFLKNPRGVLLITPEALEATLCNRGHTASTLFSALHAVVVDELHSFIGTERGKQLQSLLHRIDTLLGRQVRRVGLSATLGDLALAGRFLRPASSPGDVSIIDAGSSGGELRVLVKGYEEGPRVAQDLAAVDAEDSEPATPAHIADHLFASLRGSNNLVFPNSRREVERYTRLLSQRCEQAGIPNQFWPHHGSLSKELREDTEMALKGTTAATAICTNTLELGIDIGAVRSVAQVGAPASVASLRQRLGRSGRREGEAAILRGYCSENASEYSTDHETLLKLDTVQMAALVRLLVKGWYEPPLAHGLHLSTLIQQLLSLIAQKGGVTAAAAFRDLCGRSAPFGEVSKADFVELLRHLGTKELIQQDVTGTLLLGRVGEAMVGHFSFYAAFSVDEEYRVLHGGRVLGTLPVDQLVKPGQRLVFGGKTWRVDLVDEDKKTLLVSHARGGAVPLFLGHGGRVHAEVRQEMRRILQSADPLPFLDATAQRFLTQARGQYAAWALDSRSLVQHNGNWLLFTWAGDDVNEALVCLLASYGFTAWMAGPCIEVLPSPSDEGSLPHTLDVAARRPAPPLETLLADAYNIRREKWDWALPPALLRKAYCSLNLDVGAALAFLASQDWIDQLP